MISIVVPVYNVEKYLKKCVDSIVSQTYKDLEILLIDDGSKDNSGNLAEELAKTDTRIKVYHKANGGLSDARNYGISKASGEYCLLIDSDDYIREDCVELCVKSTLKYHSDIVVFDMTYVYDDHTSFSSGGNFEYTSFEENKDIISINNSACNKMFKTELLKKIEFPKGMLYEDLATIPILLKMAKRISKVDEPLYYYVQREGSIVHKLDMRVFDIYKAIDRIKTFCCDESNADVFEKMYIKHGLFLTTIRIKDNAESIEEFLKINNENLDKYYPNWRKLKRFEGYGIRNIIIFKLLQKNRFKMVKLIYGK